MKRFGLIRGLLLLLAAAGVRTNGGEPASAPAAVANRVKESELTTITLTSAAETHLGIEVVAAERKRVQRVRRVPGEVMVPPGRSIVVSAPVAGVVTVSAASQPSLTGGERVARGQGLLRLQAGEGRDGNTFVPADRISLARARADLVAAQVEAEGQLGQARVRVEAAEIRRKRADELRQQGAGAQRAFDDAQAEFELATTQHAAAQGRLDALRQILTALETDGQSAVMIESPLDGYLRALHAAPGEVVAAGAPLFEVAALDPIWVRVPVYVGDLPAFTATDSARVCGLGGDEGSVAPLATRLGIPGNADARAATVDLHFEVANADAELRPGQRVMIEMMTNQTTDRVVVPHTAIVVDIHGGAWVYEMVGPHKFTRRRVDVRDVIGREAVLARGLPAGARVVTSGAAELFGTEFGVGK
ncbi:MAG: efflux RND transporter periplasmic adaptor subunit [Phycisphaerae bacterium]|nr:efflux RND transporter periplasmic adaptor subunit [Phycisphaerae bacterium]